MVKKKITFNIQMSSTTQLMQTISIITHTHTHTHTHVCSSAGVIIYGGSSVLEGCKVFLINGFEFPQSLTNSLSLSLCVCVCVCVRAYAPKESQTADSPGVVQLSPPPSLHMRCGERERESDRQKP